MSSYRGRGMNTKTVWLVLCTFLIMPILAGCETSSQPAGSGVSTVGTKGGVTRTGKGGVSTAGPVDAIAVESRSATMFKSEFSKKCKLISLGSEGLPAQIRVGDTVRVKGHEMLVKRIMMGRWIGEDVGICSVYEDFSEPDPSSGEAACFERVWIKVKKCRDISGQ